MRLFAILFLTLSACTTPMQVQPALKTAGLLKDAFIAEQANTNAFVASGNPPAAQMTAFTAAQGVAKQKFFAIYQTHVTHLLSLGQFDEATTTSVLNQIKELTQ